MSNIDPHEMRAAADAIHNTIKLCLAEPDEPRWPEMLVKLLRHYTLKGYAIKMTREAVYVKIAQKEITTTTICPTSL